MGLDQPRIYTESSGHLQRHCKKKNTSIRKFMNEIQHKNTSLISHFQPVRPTKRYRPQRGLGQKE